MKKILKILYFIIILYIIIQTLYDNNNLINYNKNKNSNKLLNYNKNNNLINYDENDNLLYKYKNDKYFKSDKNYDISPWSNIYKLNNDQSIYCIKIDIPSLNDYENWKQLVDNIDFDPRTKEMKIIAESEATALAIVNLMIANFNGDISLHDILNKNLIEISIHKANNYNVVKIKLKEQLNNRLQKKIKIPSEFKKDLAYDNKNYENIDAYEGNDYSYL